MNIHNDEHHGYRTLIFHPVRARAEFSENLAWSKLLFRSIVVVIGQDPGEHINDSGIALMAVQADVAARRHDRSAEAQFAILNAVDLLGEIDGGEHVLADEIVVGWRGLR